MFAAIARTRIYRGKPCIFYLPHGDSHMFYVLFCHYHFSDTVREILRYQTKHMLQNLNQNALTSLRKGINIT